MRMQYIDINSIKLLHGEKKIHNLYIRVNAEPDVTGV